MTVGTCDGCGGHDKRLYEVMGGMYGGRILRRCASCVRIAAKARHSQPRNGGRVVHGGMS